MDKPGKLFSIRYDVKALGEKKGEVKIYSVITDMKWWPDDPGVTSNDFDKALKALGEVDELTIRINSPGGLVNEAVAIRSMLINHPAKKTIDIEGDCCSAATLIACLPKANVRMAKGATFMIHRARRGARGTADDMMAAYNNLVKVDRDMADIYAQRTGMTAEECLELMKAETWYTAEEAKDAGFADEVITGQDEDEPIVACAVDAETMELMRACYDHTPDHPIISNRADAAAAEAHSEYNHLEGGNEMPELNEATAEHTDQETPVSAQEIARQAVEAERERIQEIESMTPPGASFAQMRNDAIHNGTSIGDYIKQIVAAQKKQGADYLESRREETKPAAQVKGGSSEDNNPDASAKALEDKFAEDVAKLAGQEQNKVQGMAQ